MDPISAAASILGVVAVIATATNTATTFLRDVREARNEIVALKKDLASLGAVLEIIADDFRDSTKDHFRIPDNVLRRVVAISSDCQKVVHEIQDYIQAQRGSRVIWASSGKATIRNLQDKLEGHKSALSLTLDFISVLVLRDLKDDTEQIIQTGSAIKEDTGQIKEVTDQIHVDIHLMFAKIDQLQSQLEFQHLPPRPSDYMLKRYLEELRTDAETVLGSPDHLEEDYQPSECGNVVDTRPSSPVSTVRETKTSLAEMSQNLKTSIIFTDLKGDVHIIPFSAWQTWSDMSNLIKTTYAEVLGKEQILKNEFDIIRSDNNMTIIPSVWDKVVKPGFRLTMKLWDSKIKALYTPKEKEPVILTDCLGRELTFPFEMCSKKEGIHDLITDAFAQIPKISDYIRRGYYYLLAHPASVLDHGSYPIPIPPQRWSITVHPAMRISMEMWALPASEPQPSTVKTSKAPLERHVWCWKPISYDTGGRLVQKDQDPAVLNLSNQRIGESGNESRSNTNPLVGWINKEARQSSDQSPKVSNPVIVTIGPKSQPDKGSSGKAKGQPGAGKGKSGSKKANTDTTSEVRPERRGRRVEEEKQGEKPGGQSRQRRRVVDSDTKGDKQTSYRKPVSISALNTMFSAPGVSGK
ncbi:hypothetical protein QBC43DRAFT_312744 [Cladorrhinum sp. PSN259]|nr:hypothetical protein QBC43DRAFT_312744 [Cladorrhinum sp. PSN259]